MNNQSCRFFFFPTLQPNEEWIIKNPLTTINQKMTYITYYSLVLMKIGLNISL